MQLRLLTGISLCLMALLASCAKFEQAPPTGNITGIYAGDDSLLMKYSNNHATCLFGSCLDVQISSEGGYSIKSIPVKKAGEDEYVFDFTKAVDFGVGNEPDIHLIEHKGTCTFTKDRILITYSVGEKGTPASQYKFIGWK